MRRSVLLLGPLVAAGALFACENDSSSGGPGTFTVEAGTFDAPASDSPAPDSEPPKPAGVTVSVTRTGLPAAGVSVVFHDAAGAVVQVVATGADGTATSTGTAPAMASALLGGSGAVTMRHVVTWVDVKAGDVLSTIDFADPTVVAQYDVSFGSFADGGVTIYNASSGACGGSGDSPIAIPLSRGCLNPTNSVLGIALGMNGDPIAAAYKKGIAAPSTDGGVGAVTLGPWLAPSTLTVTVANAPAGSIDALVGEYSEGATYLSRTRSFEGSSTTLPFAPGFAEALEPVVLAVNPTGGGIRTLIKRIPPGPAVAFDFATALPAILTGTNDRSNVARPVLAWTAESPLSGSDGGHVTFAWSNQGWTFIVPPTATSVKAPVLPPEAAAWLPTSGAFTATAGQIIFADVDSVPSYDVFRKGAGRAFIGPDLFSGALLPQNGTLRTTTFVVPLD